MLIITHTKIAFSRKVLTFLIFMLLFTSVISAQDVASIKIVKPVEIHEILNNPGIGFTTFNRFNGDKLDGNKGYYPRTSIAYFRIYWFFLEPEQGQYNWSIIDRALKTAAEHGQTLMIRLPPHSGSTDVPAWYRKMVGKEVPQKISKWRVDPCDQRYTRYYGDFIRAFGNRYDGHPDLESVDISIVGSWGEGAGTHLMPEESREALINAYLDSFKKTPLSLQALNGDAPDPGLIIRNTNIAASWPDGSNNGTGPQMVNVGWRVDCIGDMGFWPQLGQNHMTDFYPRGIIKSGMGEAWKKAPVTMEICGTFQRWLKQEKYTPDTVKYIFDQAIKWHLSSFNAKSSAVPDEWVPLVRDWLNRMGYRFVLRRFTYPSKVNVNGQLPITTWWENKGNAPIYKDYKFAIRLKNSERTEILGTDAYLPDWLPGDVVYDEVLYIPHDMPAGNYQIEVALVAPVSFKPAVKLAISGINKDGWYPMGEIAIQKSIE